MAQAFLRYNESQRDRLVLGQGRAETRKHIILINQEEATDSFSLDPISPLCDQLIDCLSAIDAIRAEEHVSLGTEVKKYKR